MDIPWGELFKGVVWDNLVKAAIKRLFAAAPWLSWGPLGWLTSFVIVYISDLIYEELSKFIDVQYVIFKNAQLRDQWAKTAVDLKAVALKSGIESEEFKKARHEQTEKFSEFVRFAVAR